MLCLCSRRWWLVALELSGISVWQTIVSFPAAKWSTVTSHICFSMWLDVFYWTDKFHCIFNCSETKRPAGLNHVTLIYIYLSDPTFVCLYVPLASSKIPLAIPKTPLPCPKTTPASPQTPTVGPQTLPVGPQTLMDWGKNRQTGIQKDV